MLQTFIGPTQLGAFWKCVTSQGGRILSPSAASIVLRCSFEQLSQLIESGDVEAWTYRPAADQPPIHSMVSIPSVVRHGIRTGRFHSAHDRDLSGLNVSDAEFATLRAEATAGKAAQSQTAMG